MLDLNQKCFGYGQLWPLRPVWNQGQIIYAGSDYCIRFGSSLPKRPHQTMQNRPRSNLDGLVRFWLNVSGLETSRCARIIRPCSGRMKPTHYQFPNFRLGCVLWGHVWKNATESESGTLVAGQLHSATTGPDDACTPVCFLTKYVWPKPDQPGSDLVLDDCVRSWPNGSSLEASQLQESSGLLLAIASEPIQIGCKSDLACLLGQQTRSLT